MTPMQAVLLAGVAFSMFTAHRTLHYGVFVLATFLWLLAGVILAKL